MQQREDWYAYLRLSPQAPTEEIEQAVERLSRQAAALAVTAPERSQLLRETVRSIKRDLLSGPESRQRYDAGLAAAAQQAVPPPQPQPQPQPQHAMPPVQQLAPPAQPFPPAPYAPGAPAPMPPPPAPIPVSPAPAFAAEGMGSRIARFLRSGWTCSGCGKDALPSDKFCTRCGTPIKPVQPDAGAPARARPTCVSCGSTLAVNDAFCARCGTRVGS
ncbi:zinc ribbon domain-containing protein [Trebonia sp.]|uniref:double zinc ribbon domain-containing protein n=1 Tax=Trebonia sp. TaxID=2767075 RepID=UPI00262C2A26|nr:zinc ribbon domain-containing protein [Trebonia sp.]